MRVMGKMPYAKAGIVTSTLKEVMHISGPKDLCKSPL